jgi:hypothetical protein
MFCKLTLLAIMLVGFVVLMTAEPKRSDVPGSIAAVLTE